MAAVLAVVKGMDPSVLKTVAIGTTRWILNDRSSDIRGLLDQSGASTDIGGQP